MLRLPFVGPYDWSLALRMIGAHAVPGAERSDPSSGAYTRLLAGPTGPVAVAVRPGRDAIIVETPDASVAGRIRHWLDLDLDPTEAASRFQVDGTLGPLVRRRPGLRRIRYPQTFEAVVSTVLGQQVSLAAARTFAGRLTAAYGTPGPQGLTAFPTAGQVAQADPSELQRTLGVTGARARTLHAVAELFAADGDWPVPLPEQEWDAGAARLLALPGIGPWTVAYLRMRLFGDPDVVPVGDLVLRRALGLTKDRDVAPATERWRPERTYATFHLWASTAW
ncbi:MAG TPA: AlkA N-terminal domain-containing protein [Microlunatus sp.]|nr:AlkA N-terminal domain-containing protein [Microlunatus sp.]